VEDLRFVTATNEDIVIAEQTPDTFGSVHAAIERGGPVPIRGVRDHVPDASTEPNRPHSVQRWTSWRSRGEQGVAWIARCRLDGDRAEAGLVEQPERGLLAPAGPETGAAVRQ
jgi:hypothetical protein